jgi:hypothetical protein
MPASLVRPSRAGCFLLGYWHTKPMQDAASSNSMLPRLALLLAVVGVAFAGCASNEDPGPAGDATTPGDGAADPLTGGPDGSAPTWSVGQWWDHKWFFGSTATEAFTVKAIVAEDKGSAWVMATDDNVTSAIHAAFLLPTLGDFPKGEVTAVVGDYRWPWYDFPLSDNKTWSSELTTRDGAGGSYGLPLTSTATVARGIVTAAGVQDGFAVEARTAGSDGVPAGRLFARYDYVPAIGWMSQATFYDVATDEGQAQFILELSAAGTGYSGPFFESQGDVLSTHFNMLVPAAPTAPNPSSTFTMTAAHTHLFGFLFNFAAAGAHSTELVAPDGRRWDTVYVADADGGAVNPLDHGLIFVPSATGEWRVATVGAAAFAAGGGIQAYGITQRAGQL